jgi:flagellar protein FliL
MAEKPAAKASPAPAPAPAPASKPAAAAPRRRRLVWIVAACVVVVAAGTAAAAYLLMPAARPGARGAAAAAAAPAPAGPAQYLALDPPFVVNFQADQLVRFLQVSVQVMSRDPATLALLKANDPVVRNDLLMLFANQKYSQIGSREGMEQLRAEALTTTRNVLARAGGRPERLEALYFTSFVMQ